MNKTLIEEGSAELLELFDKISEEAKKEKLAIPPINRLVYWWTRKPLIVGRAVALAATLQNIEDMRGFLKLNHDKRAHTFDPGKEMYALKLGRDPSTIKVLDPFAGAGNLIYEAKRLGLQCFSMDYNPVAFLIQRAVLEYPARYGEKLADDVERYGTEVIERTRKEVGSLYDREEDGRSPALAYLWAWCIKCPYCNQRLPLLNHMWLARRGEKKRIGISIRTTRDLDFKIDINNKIRDEEAGGFTQKGGKAICIRCRNSISYEQMTSDISKRKDKELICVVVDNKKKGKAYESPTEADKAKLRKAGEMLKKNWDDLIRADLVPVEEIRPDHRREHHLWKYGIRNWYDFYNERQLVLMTTLLRNIRLVCEDLASSVDREYARTVATYLSFMLCKHVDFNCMGIGWSVTRETITGALSFRRPSFFYNFAETNSFEEGSGSLRSMLDDVVNAIRYASRNTDTSTVIQASALSIPYPEKSFDLIITDPPYADDVQYGELSDFFEVWISRVMKGLSLSELPPRAELDQDITVSWGRFGDRKTAEAFYEKGMKHSFKEINRVMKDDGLAIVFFAHSTTKAWNMLLEVLRESRLKVTSSYALHTENTENPLARGKTSFMSSVVVACRKISKEDDDEEEAYFEDLVPQMEDKVKELIRNISPDKLIFMPITDLIIMVYGKVLEIATRHTRIKSFSAKFKPNFEDLISQARESILREILTVILGKSPNLLSPEVSFYIIARVFYRGHMNSDDALKMTRAYGLQGSDLESRGIVEIEEGNIRLLSFREMDLDLKPDEVKSGNLHQQLVYLEKVAALDGANKVRSIISYNNFRVNDLTQIIALLIKSYRVIQNKGEKLEDDEAEEFKVLQAIADVLGVKDSGAGGGNNNLDRFL